MADNWLLKAVISANSTGMVAALKDVNKMARTTRKYLLDVGKSAGSLSGKIGLPFAALSGVLGGFSLAGIKGAVVGFTEMGETIKRGSIQAGMSVEEYQRMKYVAEQAGTSVEGLGASLGKLNRNAGDAAAGKNKNLAGLFQKLGIHTRDANGQVRRGIDLLPELADAFKRNENPAVRARMGMALFGKAWQEIAPLLVEGSAGITQSLERMGRLKGVFNDEDIDQAKELGDKFKDLQIVFKGFQMTIAKELAPVIGPLVTDLTAWWVANKKLVSVEVAKMAKEFGAWVRSIDFKAVLAGVQDFMRSIGSLVDTLGGAKNALIALVVFMNMGAIMAFVSFGGGVLRLGMYLGGFALSALAPIAPLQLLQAEMVAANLKGAALVGTFGKLAAAAGVALAAYLGWKAGTAINEEINQRLTEQNGGKATSLGSLYYDRLHNGDGSFRWQGLYSTETPAEAEARQGKDQSRPSLVNSGGRAKVEGKVDVNFTNLPQGATVTQSSTGNMPMNVDAGWRGFATGMP